MHVELEHTPCVSCITQPLWLFFVYLSGRLLIWTSINEHELFFAALRIIFFIYNFSIQRIACRRNHNGNVCTRPHRCSPTSEMHWTVAKKKAYIWVQKYKQKWKLTGSWENLTFYDTTSALMLIPSIRLLADPYACFVCLSWC